MPRRKKTEYSETVTGALTEHAMIARLQVSRWYGTVTDREAARELAEQKGAQASFLHLKKRVLGKTALARINHVTTMARHEHKFMTLPWEDGGKRILSAEGYFSYTEKMRRYQEEFEEAVTEFLPKYATFCEKAKDFLGELRNSADYPKVEDLRSRFSFHVSFYPIPSGADFRVGLDANNVEKIRGQIESDVQQAFSSSFKDVWQRIFDVVEKFAKQLKGDGGIHQATIDNISELVEVLPILNITKDKKLEAMAKEVKTKLVVDPDPLRESPQARGHTADQANAILKKLEDFI